MTDSGSESFHSANEDLSDHEEEKICANQFKNLATLEARKDSFEHLDGKGNEAKKVESNSNCFKEQPLVDTCVIYSGKSTGSSRNNNKRFVNKPTDSIPNIENDVICGAEEDLELATLEPKIGVVKEFSKGNKEFKKGSHGDTIEERTSSNYSAATATEVPSEKYVSADKLAKDANFEEWKQFGTEETEVPNDGWDDWGTEESVFESDSFCSAAEGETSKLDEKNGSIVEREEGSNKKSFFDWNDFSSVISAVGGGISSAVETGLGLPSAEDLVERNKSEVQVNEKSVVSEQDSGINSEINALGGFLSNIGSTFVSGSLDVLETLGKATFEKLTVPKEDGKRRRLIFQPQENVSLSHVLKELREQQRSTDANQTASSEVIQVDVTFIDLFESYGGFVHLEGLEMLSANSYIGRENVYNLNSLVDKIVEKHAAENSVKNRPNEDFCLSLKRILTKIGLPYDGSHLIECEKRCYQKSAQDCESAYETFKLSLESLAELTAQSVQTLHKLGQLTMIAVSDVEEAPFAQFLSLVGNRLTFLANIFVGKLNTYIGDDEKVEDMITGVFLGSEDGFTYLQQSVRLLGPLISQKR